IAWKIDLKVLNWSPSIRPLSPQALLSVAPHRPHQQQPGECRAEQRRAGGVRQSWPPETRRQAVGVFPPPPIPHISARRQPERGEGRTVERQRVRDRGTRDVASGQSQLMALREEDETSSRRT